MVFHRRLRVLLFSQNLIPPLLNGKFLLENPMISFLCNSQSRIFKSTRYRTKKIKAEESLLPFRVISDKLRQDSNEKNNPEKSLIDLNSKCNLLLNPAEHADLKNVQQTNAPVDSKSLRVSVVGVPNAGKSTLVNQLIGSNVCAHSQKVHTTRENALGILTKDSTQIIFQDTPGIITKDEQIKFSLEESLLTHPLNSCQETDLILIVHDVSNRYVREAISKRVLHLLCRNPDTPAILVLNKLDTIPKSKRVYDLIRKLTCGRLKGIEQGARLIKGPKKRLSVDAYFKKRSKRLEHSNDDQDILTLNRKVIDSYDDLLKVLHEIKGQEESIYVKTLEALSKGLVGWPGFEDVFTVSALHGDGVDDLRDYMLQNARPSHGGWKYHQDLLSDKDPRKLVINILKSKFLDVLAHDVPYKIEPVIETWSVENGIFKLLASVTSTAPRTTNLLLDDKASHLQKVARLAEQDLQNLFHCEVFILISVNVTHAPKTALFAQPLPQTKSCGLDRYLS